MNLQHPLPLRGAPIDFAPVLKLTDNEYEFFLMLGEGHTSKEMAAWPGRHRSIKTIESLMQTLQEKLGLKGHLRVRAYAAKYVYHVQLFQVQRVKTELPRYQYELKPT